MLVRPLGPADVPAAVDVVLAALPESGGDPVAARSWRTDRIGHFAATDPEGAWVAEQDGEVAGVALAIVRDGIWGLSLMAVDPRRHARGIGTELLRSALTHDAGVRGAIIAASEDPKAMRLYARAGFDLRPCVSAGGIVDRSALPAGLRARPSDDFEALAAMARPVRGGAYASGDLAFMAARPGAGALRLADRGFAVRRAEGMPFLLVARDDAAAADLLWSCLAAGHPGATVNIEFITAGQDWAIATALDAGLALSVEGPLFTRGDLGPLRPWLPSGAIL